MISNMLNPMKSLRLACLTLLVSLTPSLAHASQLLAGEREADVTTIPGVIDGAL